MICRIAGNDIYLRTSEWTDTEDFIWRCHKVTEYGGNLFFNIDKAFTCPKTCGEDDFSQLTLWKEAQDDICPVNVQGSFLGGNHGYACVAVVSCGLHEMTEEDIGSVWRDVSGEAYCLIKVPDKSTLWLVWFTEKSMADGFMDFRHPSGMLSHLKGALHRGEIPIEESRRGQLFPGRNHYHLHMFVDDTEVCVEEDGLIQGEKISFVTEYDVPYVPAVLQYLMDHGPEGNDNHSLYSDEISERYFGVKVTYEFRRNASVSVYTEYSFDRELELSYFGLVQSIALPGKNYIYVPDTNMDTPALHDGATWHRLTPDTWRDPGKAPYRYYQFDGLKDYTKGMALVYDRVYALGSKETRISQLEHAGAYAYSHKMYPAFLSGGTVKAGQTICALAARLPMRRIDEDVLGLCWYFVDEDIVLMVDTDISIEKCIQLPYYMIGKEIHILDRTEDFLIGANRLTGNFLPVKVSNPGYAVLLLK